MSAWIDDRHFHHKSLMDIVNMDCDEHCHRDSLTFIDGIVYPIAFSNFASVKSSAVYPVEIYL